MRNVKLVASLLLVGLVVIFVVQNAEVLQVNLFFWTVEARRAVVLFVVLAIGVAVGWTACSARRAG